MKKTNGLLIFAKAPVKGMVKTRLKKDTALSNDEILLLYEAFLADVILAAVKTSSDRVYLSHYPADKSEAIDQLLGERIKSGIYRKMVKVFPQEGRDFDERLTKAVKAVLKECDNVVVIGSDLPNIQPKTIDEASAFLIREGSMVIGPSGEGGAYLVGVSQPLDFTGVFTVGVEMENLAVLARKNNLSLFLLDELTDIDVSIDLATFICNIRTMEYAAECGNYHLPANTIKAVREIGVVVKSTRGGERNKRLVKK